MSTSTSSGHFIDFSSEKETLTNGSRPDSSLITLDFYDNNYVRITLDYEIDRSHYRRIISYDFTPPYTSDDYVDSVEINAYDRDGTKTTTYQSETDYTTERNYSGDVNHLPPNCVRVSCVVVLVDPGSTYNFSNTYRGVWQLVSEIKQVSPPTNLRVTENTGNTISLAWDQPIELLDFAGYKVRYGSKTYTTSVNSATFTVLEGETYTFNVIAYDIYDEESTGVEIIVTALVEPPSKPESLSIVGFSENTVDIIWSSSTDNVGVVGYRIYLDDVLITTVTITNYNFTGLEGGTLYSLSVSAIDAAGNESEKNSIQGKTFFKHSNLTLPNENPYLKEVIDFIREKVNQFRTRNGLDPINWTDTTIIKKSTPIKATQWNEIEDSILDVYTQLDIELNNKEAKQQFEETIIAKDQSYPLQLLPRRIENIIKALQNS
ncbi:fibronectin type III domain-containing protein [Chengkuizengella sp. SCS-71B]|uniref:fibronectin type III domain-containing protein n=1 Tax=Chengkuizengella sp. SCS-71B TaxID=3115290 RepID=UPI0032C22BF7